MCTFRTLAQKSVQKLPLNSKQCMLQIVKAELSLIDDTEILNQELQRMSAVSAYAVNQQSTNCARSRSNQL